MVGRPGQSALCLEIVIRWSLLHETSFSSKSHSGSVVSNTRTFEFGSISSPTSTTGFFEGIVYLPNADTTYSSLVNCLNTTTTFGSGFGAGRVGHLSFPTLGDRSHAWSVSEPRVGLDIPVVVAQKGNYVIVVGALPVGSGATTLGPGSTQFKQFASRAVERVS